MLKKTDELKDRVEAKRLHMQSKLAELMADTRHEARVARDKLKQDLDELELQIKKGWTNLSDSARAKLAEWLKRN